VNLSLFGEYVKYFLHGIEKPPRPYRASALLDIHRGQGADVPSTNDSACVLLQKLDPAPEIGFNTTTMPSYRSLVIPELGGEAH
jgi:hypothetical protein